MTSARRILVAGPAWVGDMVMAQSLYRSLKQQHDDVMIDVIAPEWSKPMLARMPEVRNAISMPIGHGQFGFTVRRKIGHDLRTEQYDQAIVIPRSLKSALTPFFARIPQRTGYRGEMRYGLLNDIRPLDKSVLTQTVQRYVALGLPADAVLPPQEIPQPRLDVDSDNQTQKREQHSLGFERPVIGMMPGAEYGPAKQWPAHYYGELARQLTAAGYGVWVFGSHKEVALGDEIAALGGEGVANLCGRTSLTDAVDLIAACKGVVSNDSGLMHVAAATGVEVFAIYGSSSPGYTPPLTERAEIVSLGLECSPCFKRTCPLGHTDCLNNITPAHLFELITRRLSQA